MFKKPTVFVIGAGAGVDIGMPTGVELIEEIAAKVNIYIEYGHQIKRGDSGIVEAFRSASKRRAIEVNKLIIAGRQIAQGVGYARSIDSYIHTHRHDEAIKVCAKIAITQCIVEHERGSALFLDETRADKQFADKLRVKNSWLSEFMYLLHQGLQAKEGLDNIFDNVTIINFNYDRCVEQYLWRAFQELFLVEPERASELVNKLRIYHPYGVVAGLPWQHFPGRKLSFGGRQFGENGLDELSDNIRTFNEEVEQSEPLDNIRTKVSEAAKLVFLGFHFHDQNMELIKPVNPKKQNSMRRAYVTTLGRSKSDEEIIDGQIRHLMGESAIGINCDLLGGDCKKLFAEYGNAMWR